MSRPLKKTGVDVEDIAGKGFTAGRTAKKKGQFPVRPGVIGEIVVNDEDVPALLHEKLGDACGRVGGYIGESRGLVPLGYHHHGIPESSPVTEDGHGLGHGSGSLSDRTVDAQDILPSLVQNSVEGDGGFSRLTVAEDQLPLPPAYGDEGIDYLDAGLEGFCYRRSVHDGHRRPFNGEAL